ncbi:MAG: biosynthetic-type acetolactate synthase large subunit [Bacteroidales bacterium]|nr:biosynthetic-type acetolactate synthase large subunit [Bacteroidales bacterium]
MGNLIKGGRAIIEALAAEGVDTIFGYPGGGIMPFYDELYRYSGSLNHILVRHEQAAVHAAEGYARSSGKVGVCVATAGPGATNLVTGIADAMMDSTPVVCITAQVQKEGLGAASFQEADIISITLPITKWNYEVTTAQEIGPVLAKAFRIARSGRPGPVLVSITKNAQTEEVDFAYEVEKNPAPSVTDELAEKLDKMAEMIRTSQRPLLIAGHGVTISGAERALGEVALQAGMPVATTMLGLSCIPSDHPNYIGCVGMHGSHAPNRMTQAADLIIAVGMRFSDRVTGRPSDYAPKARIIHVDIDPVEIGKVIRVDLPIAGDARTVLEGLLERDIKSVWRGSWWDMARDVAVREAKLLTNVQLASNRGLTMATVVQRISMLVGNDKIVVTDVGQNQMFAARFSYFANKRSWICSGGLGTMGYGLPAAIGAKVANPDKTVIAFMGDGGFQMNIQELGTLLQTGLAVKIVLMNNSWLGMVRQWQELFYDKRYSFTHLENPDFQIVAKGYGIPSARIDSVEHLDEAIMQMMNSEGSFLLEACTVSEENIFPMIPAGASIDKIFIDNDFTEL